ncbi:DUF2069 domain-containing protein [Luteimonas aquatica]|uniref:DUF2069 domain-containing protein n=1 Tax=Luteimonas aquatica TaxID=450364 RepID=UPI001F5AEDE0|nr:DUF2069 domain-containing protein [Luteimonas aquatica]
MSARPGRRWLAAALFALSVLFSLWFHDDRHRLAALLVFALPPLLLLIGVLRGGAKAAFWSGVAGLFWFSHGVMVAWSRPADGVYAWSEIALSLLIVGAASWPGLKARFFDKRRAVDRSDRER